ncbi:hypothetical protein [Sphingosinicella terrae]|uniref:hypothetical protein n=1 Tax=Sphingosinicella terrae TaxID=2172047 RepID=UPI000E0CD026|nr:hypothetical protein [Sphingosinicella terrae]
MTMRPRVLSPTIALAAALLAGCTTVSAEYARDPELDRQALATAASQVRRCYRTPRVSFAGRQIVTRLRVRVTADGQVAGLPAVVEQMGVNPDNQPYAGRMAAAAIGAVMRCAPLQLPAAFLQADGAEFDLTFSPLARG